MFKAFLYDSMFDNQRHLNDSKYTGNTHFVIVPADYLNLDFVIAMRVNGFHIPVSVIGPSRLLRAAAAHL